MEVRAGSGESRAMTRMVERWRDGRRRDALRDVEAFYVFAEISRRCGFKAMIISWNDVRLRSVFEGRNEDRFGSARRRALSGTLVWRCK
jgi:hypothetical protein